MTPRWSAARRAGPRRAASRSVDACGPLRAARRAICDDRPTPGDPAGRGRAFRRRTRPANPCPRGHSRRPSHAGSAGRARPRVPSAHPARNPQPTGPFATTEREHPTERRTRPSRADRGTRPAGCGRAFSRRIRPAIPSLRGHSRRPSHAGSAGRAAPRVRSAHPDRTPPPQGAIREDRATPGRPAGRSRALRARPRVQSAHPARNSQPRGPFATTEARGVIRQGAAARSVGASGPQLPVHRAICDDRARWTRPRPHPRGTALACDNTHAGRHRARPRRNGAGRDRTARARPATAGRRVSRARRAGSAPPRAGARRGTRTPCRTRPRRAGA